MSALFDLVIARSKGSTSMNEINVEVSVIIFLKFNSLDRLSVEVLSINRESAHYSSENFFILRFSFCGFFLLCFSIFLFFNLDLDLLGYVDSWSRSLGVTK